MVNLPPIHIISVLSFAVSSNFDNVDVGVAYGIRGACIPFLANFIIACINGCGTAISMITGASVARMFVPRMAGMLGGIILIAIGAWIIFQGMRYLDRKMPIEDELSKRLARISGMNAPRRVWEMARNPFVTHPDCRAAMGLGESFVVGLGLTMTNVVTGFAAGMIGLNIVLLTLVTMLFSILAIWLGRGAGNSRAFRWIGRYSGTVSGLLLIAIGVLEIVL
jgi:putative sporulation protein YtaF